MIKTSKLYFTADCHFNQERTRLLSKRPFKDVEEMNEYMITKWNELVKPEDTVFVAGDFGDFRFRKYLNGKVILITGNYEDGISDEELYSYGFDEVYRDHYEIEHKGKTITIQHQPEKIKDKRPIKESGLYNLYGHVHKLCMVKKFGLNVGTDLHNFEPIDFDTVEFYVNGIKNIYADYGAFL